MTLSNAAPRAASPCRATAFGPTLFPAAQPENAVTLFNVKVLDPAVAKAQT